MIIDFESYKNRPVKLTKQDKLRYMCKGDYEEYTCNTCGADIIVYGNDRPEYCSVCKKHIDWSI